MSQKIGRNDPCPCGSGKKYKKCCRGKDRSSPASASSAPRDLSPEFPRGKFRFEAGSYSGPGTFVPSIACFKLVDSGDWEHHFVLVKPDSVYDLEDPASDEASDDLDASVQLKHIQGSDLAMAEELRSRGYVSVSDFQVAAGDEEREQDPSQARAAVLEAVENQLRDDDPPEAREALERLLRQGHSEEDAKDLIAALLSREIYYVMTDGTQHDAARYTTALKALPSLPDDLID